MTDRSKPKVLGGISSLEEWSLPAADKLADEIERAVVKGAAEAVNIALSEATVSFTCLSEPPVEPLEFDVVYPEDLFGPPGTQVRQRFNLGEAIAFDLERCREDGSHKDRLLAIRRGLLDLADAIGRATGGAA